MLNEINFREFLPTSLGECVLKTFKILNTNAIHLFVVDGLDGVWHNHQHW